MGPNKDFITDYLSYVGDTECPAIYHRWCAISLLGAYLGRNFYFKQGHFNLYTNLYVMLIGVSGTRKSTAIKIAKKIIVKAGYNRISAERTSKEKFLLDLAEGLDGTTVDDLLDQNLWGGTSADGVPSEMYIACDEFNDFIGNGNVEFISMLGSLWDFNGTYTNRIKSGKSVRINDPTISILGGNTPVNFARAFPPEILGQGFFSRLLLIQGDPTGRRITWATEPSETSTIEIVERLQEIKQYCIGHVHLTPIAAKLLDKIYQKWTGLEDIRFDSYGQRRFGHLIKLTLILAASNCSRVIEEVHVVYANTILTRAESLMPKALGEFGKSRYSDTSHKIIQILSNATRELTFTDLWKELPGELEKMTDLAGIMQGLIAADKVFTAGRGFLIKKRLVQLNDSDVLDYGMLTEKEREG